MRFETLPALGRAFRAGHPDVELLTQELWNARMPAAFPNGGIDVALSLSPEIAAELELAPIRNERMVVLLPEAHPLAGEEAIPLSALADDEFIVFPRDIAPRLHDAFLAIFRRAGFEPSIRPESFHTGLGPRGPGRGPRRRDRSPDRRERPPGGCRGRGQRADRRDRDLPRLAQRR